MSYTKACCSLPPISHEYKEIGKYTQVNDFQVYESGSSDARGVLIVAYDVFGFHNATHQFVDHIGAKSGLRVLVPDYFKGNALTAADFPPKDPEAMKKRVGEAASPQQCIQMTHQVLEYYKIDTKTTPTAIIGFCWGGFMGNLIIQNLQTAQFKAFAVCHPSVWTDETGSEITVPLIAIPTKDDFDMTKFFENLKPEIREKSEHHRFNDVHHGFAAARADLQDETNLRQYNRAIDLISEFFNKRLF